MKPADANAIIEQHLKLVEVVVGMERRKLGVSDPTLVEEMRANAQMGLVSAAEKYDPKRQETFKAYAMTRMRYAVYDGMQKSGWFPRRLKRKIAFFRRASELTRYHSQDPAPADRIEAVHRLSNQLKELATAYVTTYVEETKDSASVPPEAEDEIASRQLSRRIKTYVSALPIQQQKVIQSYFFDDLNVPEIADRMGVSTSWVSKLMSAGLKSLREMLESQGKTSCEEMGLGP